MRNDSALHTHSVSLVSSEPVEPDILRRRLSPFWPFCQFRSVAPEVSRDRVPDPIVSFVGSSGGTSRDFHPSPDRPKGEIEFPEWWRTCLEFLRVLRLSVERLDRSRD